MFLCICLLVGHKRDESVPDHALQDRPCGRHREVHGKRHLRLPHPARPLRADRCRVPPQVLWVGGFPLGADLGQTGAD